jgi:cell division protein FtsI/penicillin-binding protein 2
MPFQIAKAAIEKYDVQHGAFAIMMDVNTGAILGMAIEDSYDPNHYLEIMDLSVLAELDKLSEEMADYSKESEQYKELAKEHLPRCLKKNMVMPIFLQETS